MTLRRLLSFLLVLLLATPILAAEDPGAIRTGHWVRFKGALEDGRFVASSAEIREAEDHEELVGTVTRDLGPLRFTVLGQEVHVSGKTELDGVAAGALAGARVKVSGRYRGPRKFSAREIESRDPGRDRIEGRVDAVQLVVGGFEFRVMNFDVFVPADLELDMDDAASEFEVIAPRFSEQAILPEVDDEDDFLPGTIRISDTLTLGGQLELDVLREGDYDLDADDPEDRTDVELALRAELVWQARDDLYFLTDLRHRERWRRDEDEPRDRDTETQIGEAYGYWRNVRGSSFDLQVGRQDFDERREWVYDQNLDAVRLMYVRPDWKAELSLSTTFSDGTEFDEDATNWIAYLSNNDRRRHAAAYVIDRNGRSGDHPRHFGLRAYGDWIPTTRGWAELALVRGELGGRELDGWGMDLGATWVPFGEKSWNFTVGYAIGSGDADPAGKDGNFVQTGLHDNNDKFFGVTSFRYYGELVEPELSNMSIFTLGVGRRIATHTSVDLLYHKYDQVEALAAIRDTDLDATPDGISSDLGWELDFVLGSRLYEDWHLEMILGRFEPGEAFPGADPAWLGRVQLRFKF